MWILPLLEPIPKPSAVVNTSETSGAVTARSWKKTLIDTQLYNWLCGRVAEQERLRRDATFGIAIAAIAIVSRVRPAFRSLGSMFRSSWTFKELTHENNCFEIDGVEY